MADSDDDVVIIKAASVVMVRRGCSSRAAREYLTHMADGIEITVADFASLFLFAVDYADEG
jgi:hypothetical protein